MQPLLYTVCFSFWYFLRFNKFSTSLYNKSILCDINFMLPWVAFPHHLQNCRTFHSYLWTISVSLHLFGSILFISLPQAAADVVDEVKREIEAVKSKISKNTVSQALQNLRQLLSHPHGVFYVHLAMAALEHLSDIAWENGEEHAPRYNAILKQTRGLFGNQAIQ